MCLFFRNSVRNVVQKFIFRDNSADVPIYKTQEATQEDQFVIRFRSKGTFTLTVKY
jgi:hypothetical protein